MATFVERELHLVKKALAIAVLAIERQAGPFQSISDQAGMKVMLDHLITSDAELADYAVQLGSLLRVNETERRACVEQALPYYR